MKVIDPGHVYELDHLDNDQPWQTRETLHFVKRVGPKFPGNEAPGHPGTITQEVLRVLIDRTIYVDTQRPHSRNREALWCLRMALAALEIRAAEERGDQVAVIEIIGTAYPERMPTCAGCGHVLCTRSHT